MPVEGFLRVAEAASELGVSARRVRQLIMAGALQAQRLSPRLYLVERTSVERYKGLRRSAGRPRRKGG
jgi:excisionase family DNA binding protein